MVFSGVIRPPPEIRAVADRTALYVAKNGRAFEQRILGSEKGKTPKFAFLHQTSPFHAYYEDRIQFYENGGEDNKEEQEAAEQTAVGTTTKESKNADVKESNSSSSSSSTKTKTTLKPESSTKASVIDPVAKAILTERSKIAQLRLALEESETKKPKLNDGDNNNNDHDDDNNNNNNNNTTTTPVSIPAPAQFHFLNIVAPASLSIAQLESIQLVAQLVAIDGKGGSFLSQLTYREWNNPTFAFCQPRHGHFPYFSALVDAYRRILTQWTTTHHLDDNIGTNSNGNTISSSSSMHMEDPISLMANNVDQCLHIAAYRAEYEHDIERQAKKRDDNGVLNATSFIDWHDFVVVETIDFAADETVELSMLPPPQNPVETPFNRTTSLVKTESTTEENVMDESDGDDDGDDDDEVDEPIRVVPSYTPRIVSAHDNKVETVIDPITGKSVPVKDMPEHMRIQLLDPKWAEERKKFQDKQKESNLVSGDIVASNLERFAQARGDGFGRKDHEHLNAESDTKKRLLEANRIIREHSQTQTTATRTTTTIGPSLHDPGQFVSSDEPSTKRQRIDPRLSVQSSSTLTDFTGMIPPPPPPPPPPPFQTVRPVAAATTTTTQTATAVVTTPEDPFAAAATATHAVQPPVSSHPLPTMATPNPGGGTNLLSEADFVATLNKPTISIQIRVPNDSSQMAWNFYGQIVSITVDVMSDVKTVKTELSNTHLNGIASNKIQLKNPMNGSFLKDALTLAALNIGPGTTLELVPRARGGKKK